MPRETGSSKRKNELLYQFDIEYEKFLSEIEEEKLSALDQITETVTILKSQIPSQVKNMTLAEIRALGGSTLNQVVKRINTDFCELLETKSVLKGAGTSHTPENVTFTVEVGASGVTAGRSNSSDRNNLKENDKVSVQHRRSRSANSLTRRGQNTMLRGSIDRVAPRQHNSRYKYRLPGHNGKFRPKASSTGQTKITPKMVGSTPLTLLRPIRHGEIAYSLSGSPLVASADVTALPNVYIPLKRGVLNVQPGNLGAVDKEIVDQLDTKTIERLKQLKDNIDRFVKKSE